MHPSTAHGASGPSSPRCAPVTPRRRRAGSRPALSLAALAALPVAFTSALLLVPLLSYGAMCVLASRYSDFYRHGTTAARQTRPGFAARAVLASWYTRRGPPAFGDPLSEAAVRWFGLAPPRDGLERVGVSAGLALVIFLAVFAAAGLLRIRTARPDYWGDVRAAGSRSRVLLGTLGSAARSALAGATLAGLALSPVAAVVDPEWSSPYPRLGLYALAAGLFARGVWRALPRRVREALPPALVRCSRCSYRLDGLGVTGRCPECGSAPGAPRPPRAGAPRRRRGLLVALASACLVGTLLQMLPGFHARASGVRQVLRGWHYSARLGQPESLLRLPLGSWTEVEVGDGRSGVRTLIRVERCPPAFAQPRPAPAGRPAPGVPADRAGTVFFITCVTTGFYGQVAAWQRSSAVPAYDPGRDQVLHLHEATVTGGAALGAGEMVLVNGVPFVAVGDAMAGEDGLGLQLWTYWPFFPTAVRRLGSPEEAGPLGAALRGFDPARLEAARGPDPWVLGGPVPLEAREPVLERR